MTPDQASGGLVELVLPEGGRVLVDIREDDGRTADLEADIVQVLLEAAGGDSDVCSALRDLAHDAGLTARYSLERDSVIVAFATTEARGLGRATTDALSASERAASPQPSSARAPGTARSSAP